MAAALGVAQAVVAGDGTLAYVSGTAAVFAPRTLVWVDRQGRETPIPAPPRRYVYPRLSPDGRWLAYGANDSGRFEISVRPFPLVNSGHWQVSAAGGTRPLWTRNGQELIYVSPTVGLMSVGVARGTSWAVTRPALDLGRTYDVGPDGRFLMIKGGGTDPTAAPAGLVVVQHWGEELKRLVPTPE